MKLNRAFFALALLFFAQVSYSALGDQKRSALTKSKSQVKTSAALYSIVTNGTQRPDGTYDSIMNEYVSNTGVVFAISWRSPMPPSYADLLGTTYASYQGTQTSRFGHHQKRQPVNVQTSDLVVKSSGHPGAYRGKAFLLSQFPQGVTKKDIKIP